MSEYNVDMTTSGGYLYDDPCAGMQSRGGPWNIKDTTVSGTNPLEVGQAVVLLSDGVGSVKDFPGTPFGIVHFNNLDPKSHETDPPHYEPKCMIPIMTGGYVYVTASENIKAGDGIVVIKATGKLGGTTAGVANGTTRIAFPGAIWMEDVANGDDGEIHLPN